MAIQTIKTRICDMCSSDEAVQRYQVNYMEIPQRLSVDLCQSCGAPLEEIKAKMPTQGKRGRPKGQPVVTEATVAAARKKTTRKRAVKKA